MLGHARSARLVDGADEVPLSQIAAFPRSSRQSSRNSSAAASWRTASPACAAATAPGPPTDADVRRVVVRVRRRLERLGLVGARVLSLMVATPAVAQPAYPLEAFYGTSGSIGATRIAIRNRFLRERAIPRFVLELTLDELRATGSSVFLGTKEVALVDTTFVVEGLPTPRYSLIDVPWTTVPLESDSNVRVCLQLYRIRRDSSLAPRGDVECREMTPGEPL
jgi:hypothetical protein